MSSLDDDIKHLYKQIVKGLEGTGYNPPDKIEISNNIVKVIVDVKSLW